MPIDFEKHNREQKNKYAIVIPLHFAEQIITLGAWDKYKNSVYVSLPLKWSATPPEITLTSNKKGKE